MNPTRRVTAVRLPPGRALMVLLAMLIGIVAAWPAHAQGQPVDPPGRVARLSDADGQIWLYNGDSREWVSIARNHPMSGRRGLGRG